uniref:PDZ domain-containing protein n=1 Tax=Noctiluca scintillans TaxID=2966 RepID=A0A7S1AJU8_NOCSC|mmetsp:Transcript_48497/g.128501  ORF Transcript_48497/g.128501 Transcript_48497/m.128501 type:complete len:258 (+) Transcript_48497:66-839(+)
MLCGDFGSKRSEEESQPSVAQLVPTSRTLDDSDEEGGLVVVSKAQRLLSQPVSRSSGDHGLASQSICCKSRSPRALEFDEQENSGESSEDECRWERRRLQTGVAARIVIYAEGVSPQEDMAFRDGANGRIVVAGVRRMGLAWLAGVSVKDVLVSIDGKKDFLGMSAKEVYDRLTSPCTLVLLGFVGKLMAEVRLSPFNDGCGLSWEEVAEWENAELMDEVVFQPSPPFYGIVPRSLDKDSAERGGEPVGPPDFFIRL